MAAAAAAAGKRLQSVLAGLTSADTSLATELLVQPPAAIGDRVEDVDTPALLVDLEVLEANLQRMQALSDSFPGIELRPHFKMHKTPAIAKLQVALGAVGLCCQKVGEAEVMAAAGISNILVSNEVVSPSKLRKLAVLSKTVEWLGVCADNQEAVDRIEAACAAEGAKLDVLVELDFVAPDAEIAELESVPFHGGYQRCGVAAGPELVALAAHIAAQPHLTFGGLQAYYGKAQHIVDYAEREAAIASASRTVAAAVADLKAAGLPCPKVSGAGTGTAAMEAGTGMWNELQAGSYAFMDVSYNEILMPDGAAMGTGDHADASGVSAKTSFSPALHVLTEVMSLPGPGRAVVDAGLKASSVDSGLPVVAPCLTDVSYLSASDEHGRILMGPAAAPLALGQKIKLIPGHCDPTVNMYDWLVGVRGGVVETIWRVAGRGMR